MLTLDDFLRAFKPIEDAFQPVVNEIENTFDPNNLQDVFSPVIDAFDPDKIKQAFDPLTGLPDLIKREIGSVKDKIESIPNKITSGFDSAISPIKNNLENIGSTLKNIPDDIKNGFKTVIDPLVDATHRIEDGFNLGISKIKETNQLIDNKIASLPSAFNDILVAQFAMMNEFFKKGFSTLKNELNDNITKNINLGVDKIKSGSDETINTLKNSVNDASNLLVSKIHDGSNFLKSELAMSTNTIKSQIDGSVNSLKVEWEYGTGYIRDELKMSTNTIKSQFDKVIIPELTKVGTEIAAGLEKGVGTLTHLLTTPFRMLDGLGQFLAQPSNLIYIAGAGMIVLAIKS